ncbi:MAG: Holliday junction branch migration protein RuvA [Bacteroidales bacterium]|nr:Holliday junction branch migration protein RuvA [Bacteroidales bacterium]
MYNYIEGKLVEINPAYAVIDCGGVGYLIRISINTYTAIKDEKQCKLLIHLNFMVGVQGSAMDLYGFSTESERKLFRLLVAVSGVGMNTALLILSALSPSQLVETIASENINALKSVKGIGIKTAQRIVIELKDKIEKDDCTESIKISPAHNTKREEALSGLIVLGFQRFAAQKVVDKILLNNPDIHVETLIKESLKYL